MTANAPPLSGRTGALLERLIAADPGTLGAHARRANLIGRYPGPHAAGKGDAFPMLEARDAAARLRLGRGPVVLLGRNVAAAFGLPRTVPFFEWRLLRGAAVAVMPHPSGVSLWWNDAANVMRAARWLESVVRHRRHPTARDLRAGRKEAP